VQADEPAEDAAPAAGGEYCEVHRGPAVMCRLEHDLHNQGVVSTSLHVDPLVVTSHAKVEALKAAGEWPPFEAPGSSGDATARDGGGASPKLERSTINCYEGRGAVDRPGRLFL
jgi:hypothetical protein